MLINQLKYFMEQIERIENGQKIVGEEQYKQPLYEHNAFDYNQLVLAASHEREPAEGPIQNNELLDDSITIHQRRIICCGCEKEINNTVSILFNKVHRCVGCFAKSQEQTEQYTIVKSLNYPLLELNWRADHQLLFLQMIEKYGYGNWKQIKQQMELEGANFEIDELRDHYHNCYLANTNFMPIFTLNQKASPNNESFFQKKYDRIHKILHQKQVNETSKASTALRTTSQFIELDDYFIKDKGSLQFYNQKRNEFDVEFDNQAEMLLANLQFREDDEEIENRFKFKIINDYNNRIQKRNQIKQFVVQHRILQEDYQQNLNNNRNQYQKRAFQKLKPLARFMKSKQFNHLIGKVAFTMQIKSTIQGFRELRRTHPNNYKNLEEFMNSQLHESKPKKKVHSDQNVKTDKRLQEILQKGFKISKRDLDQLLSIVHRNGKKGSYKNVEAVIIQKRLDE